MGTRETAQDLTLIQQHLGPDPFTAQQAHQAGLSRDRLGQLLARGDLITSRFGVYRLPGSEPDPLERVKALARVLPDGCAVGRRTAAWLFGIDVRAPDERGLILPIECIAPSGVTPLRRQGVTCFQAELDPDDVTVFDGIPCTTPARTAADLLRWVAPPMGLAGADALAAAGLVAPEAVEDVLRRWPGQRFVRRARRYASWIEPRTESFGESWLRLRILEAGFPRPEAQIRILDQRGTLVYRLDLGWPHCRQAIEYDGEEFHSDRAAQDADRLRRERLVKEFGWQVTPVGLGEVFGRNMLLEKGIGELLGLAPAISRRAW